MPDAGGLSLVEAALDRRVDAQFLGLGWRAEDASGAWVAGAEVARRRERSDLALAVTDPNGAVTATRVRDGALEADGWLFPHRRQSLDPDWEAEGSATVGLSGGDEEVWAGGRFGLASTASPALTLRGALVADERAGMQTLAPVTVVGLAPMRGDLGPDGSATGAILRADLDVGERLHLGLEHQSLRLEGLSYETGAAFGGFDVARATVHATELRSDLWLGGGFGAYASATHAEGEIDRGPGAGGPLPEAPEWTLRGGLAWVHPAQVRTSVEGVWTSERFGDPNGGRLSPVFTLDAGLSWEPFDKRLALGVEVRNLTDARPERPFGQVPLRRSFPVTAAARF